ncbi:Saccharopine dehydrogenase-domain-containing protein [Clohesyomyces aquaticus]|uniref:Saccharopine dehydrogenase-domain-containing protein n=1 Tax=Clohesyomyces aquaticus TaxID=1231657 RepID=A0A1Y1ZKF9_9PLEO|nr:Saccharopine dehydrogenase-domain-containing protein [Clohesyomyces aquaticus]
MTQSFRQYELILFGATGYTGKLTAEYISLHLPTDLKWAIAGRNAQKLQGIVEELTKLSPDRKQPDVEICELKKDQLVTLAKKTRLIITTAGPYMWYGEPVLAACAENGTHYLDCTGETPWYRDMVEKYHEVAKKNGAIIIPECGLDSVPADLLTYALTTHIRRTLSLPTSSVTLTLYDLKSGISGGSASTALNMFNHYPLSKLAASFQPWALSPIPQPKSLSAAPPSGGLLYKLLGQKYIPELGGVQTRGVMGGVDAAIVHRTWGLLQSNPNSNSENGEPPYGPHFRFTEFMRVRSLPRALAFTLLMTFSTLFLAFPPTRYVLTPLLKKYVVPAAGSGPEKDSMGNDFFEYRGLAIADAEGEEGEGKKVRGRWYVKHGGYAMTALTLGVAAEVILRGDVEGTEAGRRGGGVLTPALLGERYLQALRRAGVVVEVEG